MGSLNAYIPKSRIAHTNDNLKIVPYYVMKNPSEPSRIGSATSCMARVPVLLSKICPSSQTLKMIKPIEVRKAKKQIRLAVVLEMKR